MPPWMITIDCKSLAIICALQGTPDLGANNFPTYDACYREMMRIAIQWMPPRGSYHFNCRRWPW